MARPRKYASTSEAEIRALIADGLSFVQIADRLNLRLGSLRATASMLGIRSASTGKVPADLHAVLGRLLMGETLKEVAAGFGSHASAMRMALKHAGLPTSTRTALRQKYAPVANSAERSTCSKFDGVDIDAAHARL